MAPVIEQIIDVDTPLNGEGALGVAVSGGGDSVALLQALAEWGRRPLHVFCVDHGLNPQSGDWTNAVAGHAARLGVAFTALEWSGEKPVTGVSAAARAARHGLLADAARARGIGVLCLAHTADDRAEAAVMRGQGSNVGTPQLWSPSPVWPQGRGISLCRPLLGVRRAQLRDYLRARGCVWIDDPANENPRSLRAQARKHLDGAVADTMPTTELLSRDEVETLLHDPEGWSELGLLRFHAESMRRLPEDMAIRLLSTAVVCAGGGNRLPRRDSVVSLMERMAGGGVHTLCGARVQAAGGLIHIVREAGDMTRREGGDIMTVAGQGVVWDGRFEVTAGNVARVTAAQGQRSLLGDADRRQLARLPAGLRQVLPVVKTVEGPLLAAPAHGALRQDLYDTLQVRCWVRSRFLAAACRVRVETDL